MFIWIDYFISLIAACAVICKKEKSYTKTDFTKRKSTKRPCTFDNFAYLRIFTESDKAQMIVLHLKILRISTVYLNMYNAGSTTQS